MSLLCDRAKNKLDKSKRKYKECPQSKFPDREAELFCENCGHSLGKKDVLIIDLETVKSCSKCIEKYIKRHRLIFLMVRWLKTLVILFI